MERLAGILTSRWTQGIVFGMIVAATILHNPTMWIITGILTGAACLGLLIVGGHVAQRMAQVPRHTRIPGVCPTARCTKRTKR